MAFAGDEHGGNGRTADDVKTMQKKYVEYRIDGLPGTQAAKLAGYAPSSKPNDIERIGGPVHNLMVRALADKGITEDTLAQEYVEGIQAAKVPGAKEKDLNAHAQYLKQLGFLLGYSKQGPSVAVQINNSQQAPDFDPARIGELVGEVSSLIEVLQAEVRDRKSGGVHARDTGDQDPEAHPGVVDAAPEAQEAGGGGQP